MKVFRFFLIGRKLYDAFEVCFLTPAHETYTNLIVAEHPRNTDFERTITVLKKIFAK